MGFQPRVCVCLVSTTQPSTDNIHCRQSPPAEHDAELLTERDKPRDKLIPKSALVYSERRSCVRDERLFTTRTLNIKLYYGQNPE